MRLGLAETYFLISVPILPILQYAIVNGNYGINSLIGETMPHHVGYSFPLQNTLP